MAAGAFDRSQPPIRVDSSRAEMNPNCGVAESFSRASLPSFTEFYRVLPSFGHGQSTATVNTVFDRFLSRFDGFAKNKSCFPVPSGCTGFLAGFGDRWLSLDRVFMRFQDTRGFIGFYRVSETFFMASRQALAGF